MDLHTQHRDDAPRLWIYAAATPPLFAPPPPIPAYLLDVSTYLLSPPFPLPPVEKQGALDVGGTVNKENEKKKRKKKKKKEKKREKNPGEEGKVS